MVRDDGRHDPLVAVAGRHLVANLDRGLALDRDLDVRAGLRDRRHLAGVGLVPGERGIPVGLHERLVRLAQDELFGILDTLAQDGDERIALDDLLADLDNAMVVELV